MDLTQICAIRDEAKLIKNSEKTSDATLSGFENIKTNSLSSSRHAASRHLDDRSLTLNSLIRS